MKKFGITSVIATGFAAAVLGFAAPASADLEQVQWIQDMKQAAQTGSAGSTFGNGR